MRSVFSRVINLSRGTNTVPLESGFFSKQSNLLFYKFYLFVSAFRFYFKDIHTSLK